MENDGVNLLSTVLAQDHFFSDFLSLHLTTKTHKASTMMHSGVDSKTSSSASAANIYESFSGRPLSEWRSWDTFVLLTSQVIYTSAIICGAAN